jgi:hypothetical protein
LGVWRSAMMKTTSFSNSGMSESTTRLRALQLGHVGKKTCTMAGFPCPMDSREL